MEGTESGFEPSDRPRARTLHQRLFAGTVRKWHQQERRERSRAGGRESPDRIVKGCGNQCAWALSRRPVLAHWWPGSAWTPTAFDPQLFCLIIPGFWPVLRSQVVWPSGPIVCRRQSPRAVSSPPRSEEAPAIQCPAVLTAPYCRF